MANLKKLDDEARMRLQACLAKGYRIKAISKEAMSEPSPTSIRWRGRARATGCRTSSRNARSGRRSWTPLPSRKSAGGRSSQTVDLTPICGEPSGAKTYLKSFRDNLVTGVADALLARQDSPVSAKKGQKMTGLSRIFGPESRKGPKQRHFMYITLSSNRFRFVLFSNRWRESRCR